MPEPLLRTPEPASTLLPPLTPEDTPESLEPFAKVHALTDIELRFAATLYLQKNQKAISAKGVSKRQETMESNLAKILGYLKSNSPAPLPRIAKHINTSPGTTSHYLQILIKSHLVKATGWSAARRYSHR